MEYIKTTKFNERKDSIKYIVVHSTVGSDSRNWLSAYNLKNPESPQNEVSIHYLVMRDGKVYSIVPEDKRAWHAGPCKMPGGETDANDCSIGVELENRSDGKRIWQDYTNEQLIAAAELINDIMVRCAIPGDNVLRHGDIAVPKGRKTDPVNLNWSAFWERIHAAQANTLVPNLVKPEYSGNSPLLGRSTLSIEGIASRIARLPKQPYTLYDCKLIVGYYEKYCKIAGLDYVLVVAQCLHETDWLRSWWAQRPRRNPAGIGVTGQPGAGYSFATWDESVQAHVGHLLSYMFKDHEMSVLQYDLSLHSPRKPFIPAKNRGSVRVLNDLNGKWAVPGKTYGSAIARTAMTLI